MKKFNHFIFGLAMVGVLILGLFKFVPDVTVNVGWNTRYTASAESIKAPIAPQPNVGWNS